MPLSLPPICPCASTQHTRATGIRPGKRGREIYGVALEQGIFERGEEITMQATLHVDIFSRGSFLFLKHLVFYYNTCVYK